MLLYSLTNAKKKVDTNNAFHNWKEILLKKASWTGYIISGNMII